MRNALIAKYILREMLKLQLNADNLDLFSELHLGNRISTVLDCIITIPGYMFGSVVVVNFALPVLKSLL